MSSEVEDRIHLALKSHPLERTGDGYRLVHPGGAGVSTLRFRPVMQAAQSSGIVAVADVIADYENLGLPSLHPAGVQRLNAMAVHGAYELREGRLRQTAQFSLYAMEATAQLSTKIILDSFAAQLPIGRSVALAIVSATALEQQRAHHAMPRDWSRTVQAQDLRATTAALQERGIAAANDGSTVWAELAMSGDCPSRALDPGAETALLQVNAGVLHPIAGAGYLASISLPFPQAPAEPAELCRRLNTAELDLVDFVPRLGAWGLQGMDDLPGYHCFIPCAAPYGGLHMALMWWCVQRAAWIRDRFWVARRGIGPQAPAPD
ncbi:MAG TPA: hypothetical protein VND80_09720 [Steroidobacteraceae bacterium]|nr:hypothetical protein [Steroidobacteraceae bacterium]